MAEVTVSQFAEVLKVPVDRLLTQLDEAGIKVAGADDVISDEAKLELLTHLRRTHGRQEDAAAPRKITLKRKSQQRDQGRPGAGPRPHGQRRGAREAHLRQAHGARGRAAAAAGGARPRCARPRRPCASRPSAGGREARRRERSSASASSRRRAERAEEEARAARRRGGQPPERDRATGIDASASGPRPERARGRAARVRAHVAKAASARRARHAQGCGRPSTAGRNCTSRGDASARFKKRQQASRHRRPVQVSVDSAPRLRAADRAGRARGADSGDHHGRRARRTAWRSRRPKSSRR